MHSRYWPDDWKLHTLFSVRDEDMTEPCDRCYSEDDWQDFCEVYVRGTYSELAEYLRYVPISLEPNHWQTRDYRAYENDDARRAYSARLRGDPDVERDFLLQGPLMRAHHRQILEDQEEERLDVPVPLADLTWASDDEYDEIEASMEDSGPAHGFLWREPENMGEEDEFFPIEPGSIVANPHMPGYDPDLEERYNPS
jgi:hypothetical protein